MIDLTCVVHVHSTHSDGTGTVPEIAAAAAAAGADVVLLTDHDTLAARYHGHERWHGSVLVCVGEEVTKRPGHHYLAFGLDDPIDHRGMTPQQVVDAVAAAGGLGFTAHPFSTGVRPFPFIPVDRLGRALPARRDRRRAVVDRDRHASSGSSTAATRSASCWRRAPRASSTTRAPRRCAAWDRAAPRPPRRRARRPRRAPVRPPPGRPRAARA